MLLTLVLMIAAEETTTIRFAAKPAGEPRPVLRYRLLPPLEEIETGTALQLYLKCFMEQNNFYNAKESIAQRDKWEKAPLSELPLKELRGYGGNSLRYADQAARMSHLDWQILGDIKKKGVWTLLPEVQKLRQLAQALKVRMRGEIADKRFDDALGTAQTLFKLSSQLGDHPTLIGNLVGVAIASLTLSTLEEMIDQPGCPNLYWAISSMPAPLVPLTKAAEGERLLFLRELSRVPRDRPARDEEVIEALEAWQKVADDMRVEIKIKERFNEARKGLDEAVWRKRLVAAGVDAKVAERMTRMQLVLLDEQDRFIDAHERRLRWLHLPFWKGAERMQAEHKRREGMFGEFLPSSTKSYMGQARFQQRLAALQILEALRLHASKNGKLPKSLEEIDVPLPVDPVNGKPFFYETKDAKAILRGTPPKGKEKEAVFNLIYEWVVGK